MLTRKRQRDTLIQEHFNSLTSDQSNQFHPMLESITRFLDFKDCSNIAILNVWHHLKTWIYVLKSQNRKIRPIIDVNHKSILWLTKYSKSLSNQHLHLKSHYQNPELLFNNEACRMFFTNQQKMYCFTFFPQWNTSITTQEEIILKNIALYLKELTCVVLTMKNFPLFPCLELLHFRNPQSKIVLESCLQKCPILKTLVLDSYHDSTIPEIGTSIQKLTISSYYLTNLESLRYSNLQELDVSGCMNITDFSPTMHIPIVKK